MAKRRVFITGMGAVSPFGRGLSNLVQGIESGDSAVVSMREPWGVLAKDLDCWVGAPVREELPAREIPRTYRRSMGLSAQYAYLAAAEALGQAGLEEGFRSGGKVGVSFGSTTGSVIAYSEVFEKYFKNASLRDLSSNSFFQIMSHTAAANIAHAFTIRGRVLSPDCACSSASQAIGFGFEAIQEGRQDAMLCGGSDELHPLVSGSFDLVHASSYHFNDRPEATPRPFDRDRDGTVCGEGAGCLVLESEGSVEARGAKPLGEVLGFATLADGGQLAQPHLDSIVRCMRLAIENADLSPDAVSYVNAHATGTQQGDAAEAEGIRQVFGEKAVAVSGFKGAIGHTTGASGALELEAALDALNRDLLLPTRNLQTPSDDCSQILHVQRGDRPGSDIFLKNSFAFGGINTVLVFRRGQP